jgi:hypothetical protein
VFRWPLDLTALSIGRGGLPAEATIEVTPRGAAFTLAALSHVGHAAHLALIDAYLKGQVRGGSAGVGEDSRIVAASLATPLVAAYELGVERLTLDELILLPPARDAGEWVRLLLGVDGRWLPVRGTTRFGMAGCLGTPNVGEPWYDVIVELPDVQEGSDRRRPAPVLAEVRTPSAEIAAPSDTHIKAVRAFSLARFTEVATIAGRFATQTFGPRVHASDSPDLAAALTDAIHVRRPTLGAFDWQGLDLDVTLAPEPDGSQTLCLLPPTDAVPSDLQDTMREATWALIEALIGRPLAERRTEPFTLRLIGPNHTMTLDVGESVVIVRNQTVFAAWVGSDGRVMVKLR